MKSFSLFAGLCLAIFIPSPAICEKPAPSEAQLSKWLERFPKADANGDGQLTVEEAFRYRDKLAKEKRSKGAAASSSRSGAPRVFKVDPGWEDPKGFPKHAVSLRSREEIEKVYRQVLGGKGNSITSFEKPADGALRIVGTGHSFMAPGYRALPKIVKAAGFEEQPLFTHTGGGITGSARYKWEQENGIFQFDGKPVPKLLASIANAEWDVMMWGPYFHDRPEYYSCWIDFCLKYQPGMKFYLSDAWPQLSQLEKNPESEGFFTKEVIDRIGTEKRELYSILVETLREKYPRKVFILPTSDAMTLAAQYQIRGELPGVDGLHKVIGGKERSLWKDQLGHLGPGFDRLEGYVFYATLYGKSPELIEGDVVFGNRLRPESSAASEFPSRDLDRIFRKIAWQAVIGHPLSGVADKDGAGVANR